MTFEDLRVFSTVAAERSFSKAAQKLRRTQPAVSQAIRRLEQATGERLVDRSSRDGTLTDAGDAAARLRPAPAAAGGRGLGRGVGAARRQEGPRAHRCERGRRARRAAAHRDVPSRASRACSWRCGAWPRVTFPQEVLLRTLDFGVLTFKPAERELASQPLGTDELVLLVPPAHPLAGRGEITMEEMGRQSVIAHNDPVAGAGHGAAAVRAAARAAEHLHVAAEPRRHQARGGDGAGRRAAAAALRAGRDRAPPAGRGRVPELRSPREIRFVYRKDAGLSHAARAFLQLASVR